MIFTRDGRRYWVGSDGLFLWHEWPDVDGRRVALWVRQGDTLPPLR